ncbi:MAG: DUF29 domain-containing protein [Chloroflexi bacterium]|nr:DUF29 domain-containing protein [Chloroflexota bacterium]
MEEILTLRQHLEEGRYDDALALAIELEEMSREDKINKIRSYVRLLLLHLIKQAAEKRTTRSWDVSIRNAAREIAYVNQRRSSGGSYLSEAELSEIIAETYQSALENASLEAYGGIYDDIALGQMVNQAEIEAQALDIIVAGSSSH